MEKKEEQLSLGLSCGLEEPKPILELTTHCPDDGTEMTLDFEEGSVAGDVACPKCTRVLRMSEKDLERVRQLFREKGLL